MFLIPLLLVASQALPVAERPDPMSLGPAKGEKLPAFEATDSNGVRRTFESLKGPAGLVLVFFRSADW